MKMVVFSQRASSLSAKVSGVESSLQAVLLLECDLVAGMRGNRPTNSQVRKEVFQQAVQSIC